MFGGAAGLATGTAAVLVNAQPLLILLPAWWFSGEALSARTTAALLVGFAGAGRRGASGGGGSGHRGTLLSRRLGSLDVLVATGWLVMIGGVALAGLAGAVEGAPVIAWTPHFLPSLAFLAFVVTRVFAGYRTEIDLVVLEPQLLACLVSALFVLLHRGQRLRVRLDRDSVEVQPTRVRPTHVCGCGSTGRPRPAPGGTSWGSPARRPTAR